MDRPVNLAVIGAGAIGARHARLCAQEPACRLVGIADPSPAAAALAAELGVPSTPSAEALLDDIRPDGVIVAVPTPLHESVGIAVAERGVHLLMEKPIASDAAGAQRLIEAARRAGGSWSAIIVAITRWCRQRGVSCRMANWASCLP